MLLSEYKKKYFSVVYRGILHIFYNFSLQTKIITEAKATEV